MQSKVVTYIKFATTDETKQLLQQNHHGSFIDLESCCHCSPEDSRENCSSGVWRCKEVSVVEICDGFNSRKDWVQATPIKQQAISYPWICMTSSSTLTRPLNLSTANSSLTLWLASQTAKSNLHCFPNCQLLQCSSPLIKSDPSSVQIPSIHICCIPIPTLWSCYLPSMVGQ
jgi:hypothetical protein